MTPNVIASRTRIGFVLGLIAGVSLAAAGVLARQELTVNGRAGRPDATAPIPTNAAPTTAPGTKAGSMEAATLALKTRLATQGGPDDQWELLAQSYEFLGRSAEAKLAREHEVSPSSDLRDTILASARLLPAARAMAGPADTRPSGASATEQLLASADQHRRKREFREACAVYAQLASQGAMTADTWADYADAQASLSGKLAGAPGASIDRALALDPRHTKALWLKASLAHEQHRYKDALATWQQLLTLVPPGSSDARIVEANLAEASRLATG